MTRPANRGPRHAPRVPFALLVTALVLGGLALLLVLNTASAANELQRRSLALSDDGIAAQVEQLQVQVAASAAPGNVATAAAALGMVPGGNPAFIVVGANGSATVEGHPAIVTGPPPPAAPTTRSATSPHGTTSPTHTKSPTHTTSPTHTATPTGTATPTTSPTSSPKAPKTSPTSSPKTSPKAPKTSPTTSPTSPGRHRPTHTPDPTVTLPGGPR